MTKAKTNLWKVVREIIRANYELLKDEFQRDSYYIVRDLIAPELGKRITQEEFDWFLTDQGYSTYRDDVWTSLEQNEGLQRPEAKPEGWFYDQGTKNPIEDLPDAWEQNRGWIFVEKAGEADKIKELSDYGWGVVVAGKGFPTRLVRQLLQDDDKPVLIFHDADRAGTGIYRVFGEGSRRTSHLDLIIEAAQDVGLLYGDAERLNLPSQPEPPKYRGEIRYEISSLAVLKTRMGIENPTLAYVKARMVILGLDISPTELAKRTLWIREAAATVGAGLLGEVTRRIEQAARAVEIEDGEAVDLEVAFPEARLPDLSSFQPVIDQAVQEVLASAEWSYEEEWHERAIEDVPPRLIDALKKEATT
jgi:hypothetical protein